MKIKSMNLQQSIGDLCISYSKLELLEYLCLRCKNYVGFGVSSRWQKLHQILHFHKIGTKEDNCSSINGNGQRRKQFTHLLMTNYVDLHKDNISRMIQLFVN